MVCYGMLAIPEILPLYFAAIGAKMGRLVNHVTFSRGRFVALGFCLLGLATSPSCLLDAQTANKDSNPTLEVTSALGRKLYALPDDEGVMAARKKLAADPKNVALALALSKA